MEPEGPEDTRVLSIGNPTIGPLVAGSSHIQRLTRTGGLLSDGHGPSHSKLD